METKKTKQRKDRQTRRYKHCTWNQISKAEQEFYEQAINDFMGGKSTVDEFRGQISNSEEDIEEALE